MLAAIPAIVGVVAKLFAAPATGVVSVLTSLAASLGLRFYAGLTVGLGLTDNAVRHDVVKLFRDILGAIF